MVNLELPDENMGVSDGKGEMFTVSSGGEILWSRQASFTIACQMNLERLPFDTQPCGLLAGLYSQRAEQVQLVWRDPAKYEALANWGSPCLAGWVATSLVQTNELQTFVTGNFTYAHQDATDNPLCAKYGDDLDMNAYFIDGCVAAFDVAGEWAADADGHVYAGHGAPGACG